MRGLEPPPRDETPSRIFARFAVLLIMLGLFSVFVWAAVTNQRIPLVEDLRIDAVEGVDLEVTDGVTFGVDDRGVGDTPVFLFHGVNIAGGVVFESLVDSFDGEVRTVAVDLPGFGFSTRFPSKGLHHTVRGMAERLVAVIEARADGPVIVAGVGLGGEVAAELAATRPDLVAGLVMIDVDFYGSTDSMVQSLERLPWLGNAVTYAFEVSGPFSEPSRHPYCEEGGWCLSPQQSEIRDLAGQVIGTSDSLQAFRSTSEASNVPARLIDITVPTVVVWSEKGPVPEDSIDRLVDAIPDARFEAFDVYEAVHEEPDRVADAIASLLP
jgi:pimeloyl-ACP methyl ester carboxylesterase